MLIFWHKISGSSGTRNLKLHNFNYDCGHGISLKINWDQYLKNIFSSKILTILVVPSFCNFATGTSHMKSNPIWRTLMHVSKFNINHRKYVHHHCQAPRVKHECGSAKILNIARSAGPWRILSSQTLRKSRFWARFPCREISRNFNFSPNFQIFRHHEPDLDQAQTFATEFSGSSRAQNLKLHIFIQVLDEGYQNP